MQNKLTARSENFSRSISKETLSLKSRTCKPRKELDPNLDQQGEVETSRAKQRARLSSRLQQTRKHCRKHIHKNQRASGSLPEASRELREICKSTNCLQGELVGASLKKNPFQITIPWILLVCFLVVCKWSRVLLKKPKDHIAELHSQGKPRDTKREPEAIELVTADYAYRDRSETNDYEGNYRNSSGEVNEFRNAVLKIIEEQQQQLEQQLKQQQEAQLICRLKHGLSKSQRATQRL